MNKYKIIVLIVAIIIVTSGLIIAGRNKISVEKAEEPFDNALVDFGDNIISTSSKNTKNIYTKLANFEYILSEKQQVAGAVENGEQVTFVWSGCVNAGDINITAKQAFDGENAEIISIASHVSKNGNYIWTIPSSFPAGIFKIFISSEKCISKTETPLRLEIQKPLAEVDVATGFLSEVKERFNLNTTIKNNNLIKGIAGKEVAVPDLISGEIEKYLLQNMKLDNDGYYVYQSNNGLYFNNDVYCMNFGRISPSSGPSLWCTDNKDILIKKY